MRRNSCPHCLQYCVPLNLIATHSESPVIKAAMRLALLTPSTACNVVPTVFTPLNLVSPGQARVFCTDVLWSLCFQTSTGSLLPYNDMRKARDCSPYDAKRFLYQEESETWPGPGDSPGDIREFVLCSDHYETQFLAATRLVRFASTNSISSEKADHLSAPRPHPPKSSISMVFPQASLLIAIGLLITTLLLQISPQVGANFSRYRRQITSLLPSPSRHTAFDLPPSPALRRYIKTVVEEKIKAHILASRGLRDFALRAAGARIVPELTTGCSGLFSWDCEQPNIAIDDDTRVGKCWNIPSLPAQLAVVLPELIHPSHVTVEHLPRSIAPDSLSAPRNMTLWGIIDGKANIALNKNLHLDSGVGATRDRHPMISKGHLYAPLLSFTYDINDEYPVQTYELDKHYVDSNMTFAVFVLEMYDNWGGLTTCLYRIRIHGTPV